MRARLFPALALAAALALPGPARAADGDADDGWMRSVISDSVLAASLYGAALAVSSAATFGVAIVAPLAWQQTTRTLVVPAVMVLVMSRLIPAAKATVPEAVDRWLDDPALATRPGRRLAKTEGGP